MTTVQTTPEALAGPGPCPQRRFETAIADHFAGRDSVAAAATLRAHLLGCADCDARYRRHLLLARLDPRALPAQERLGRGLGFCRQGLATRWPRSWALGLFVPAAAALALVLAPRHHGDPRSGRTPEPSAFAARGAAKGVSSFWAYRLDPDGAPRLADQAIGRTDEVAFAYANAAGRPFLMIFGVDEHRHVYWFQPGWSSGTPAPQALRAEVGPGPHELPDAIRQPFDGGRLRVYAAFADRRFDAAAVEDAVRAAANGDPSQALRERGMTVVERTFQVTP